MNKKELMRRVKEYALKVGFDLRKKKNDATRYTVYCGGSGCKWRLHSSVLDNKTFAVKTYHGGHRCIRQINSKIADQGWLASKIVVELKKNPKLEAKYLEKWVKKS